MTTNTGRFRSYRAVEIEIHGRRSWTVVDPSGLPVRAVDDYLQWLRSVDRADNTVRAYAFHLADLFLWLNGRGVTWDLASLEDLSTFMAGFRFGIAPLETRNGEPRATASCGAAAAAVREFYVHHRFEGNGGLVDLTGAGSRSKKPGYANPFLAHVADLRHGSSNRLTPRVRIQPPPKTLSEAGDFELLIAAAKTARDRLALSGLYHLGLRVGQLLGLRHGDIDIMRRQLQVIRRTDNVNGAVSKQRMTFQVEAPVRFIDLYQDYYIGELIPLGIETDYLFVNLRGQERGRPMRPENMRSQCNAIAARAGLGHVTPHMLRHTHATELARAGWDATYIAKRLGHSFAASANAYVHLNDDDLHERIHQTAHLINPAWTEGGEES